MEATGVGMMMVVAAWEGQVLGGYHSASDGYCGYVALELPIADPAQPIAALVGPNARLEGYGNPEIQK